jgi:hypothetical protein
MKTNKILIAGIAGGVTFFILGWLIYGIILSAYMQSQSNPAIMRPMAEMKWWALILSNLTQGFLVAIIYGWANVRTLSSGAGKGAILGLILAISMDLGLYSMYTLFSGLSPVVIDTIASVVMFALTGTVVGWIYSRNTPD